MRATAVPLQFRFEFSSVRITVPWFEFAGAGAGAPGVRLGGRELDERLERRRQRQQPGQDGAQRLRGCGAVSAQQISSGDGSWILWGGRRASFIGSVNGNTAPTRAKSSSRCAFRETPRKCVRPAGTQRGELLGRRHAARGRRRRQVDIRRTAACFMRAPCARRIRSRRHVAFRRQRVDQQLVMSGAR